MRNLMRTNLTVSVDRSQLALGAGRMIVQIGDCDTTHAQTQRNDGNAPPTFAYGKRFDAEWPWQCRDGT